MYIVTVGKSFNDVDAFGCAVAYAELLRSEGKEAQAVFFGPLNHSVTLLALEQNVPYLLDYTLAPEDLLVYVDVSDPAYVAFPDLDPSRVFEIFDHHYGYEAYWAEHLGERSHIERVGAAATLIWEQVKKRGYETQVSSESVNLLALAILQNTLNFTSTETNERDTRAFEELLSHVSMEAGWQERYFAECAQSMKEQFETVLRNDTKAFPKYFGDKTFLFSQLEITEEPRAFFERSQLAINAFWSEFPLHRGLVNIVDMSSKTSLLYSDDMEWLHKELTPLFSVITSSENWIQIPIHQRKQILKKLQA